ncbi:serine hydrolase domain-containing protein [Pseudomonas sp. 6D_7.1_Bac1]|uniref:serine hydrolase domain-containing protein n=1 Tax=Pseudomonas sp. 6D_7.1_Bac1 TaxID=2971615 RepID=UPI0021C676FC|nr:serine hydrolase domain-containing protein [Pseudomonas sp. 6D_7.1_Bac1]MCU1749108.1 beta-lactamase family protein [Pseudomonas sp. 6D_7.1_Bac1]
MHRSICSIPLLGLLLGSIGCNGQPPPLPVIQKGDYNAIVRYLKTQIPQEMERYNVPGLSVALVDGQQLIWARGFGYADKVRGILVSENTAFRAGSISKLLTASAALQLVETGALELDAPLQNTLKEFYVRSRFHPDQQAADRDVTLRRLLSHQAGMPGEYLRGLREPDGLGQLPMRVSGLWLSNPPGSQVAYSNLGYALVGAAIERSSRQDFERQLQQSLLRPLKMSQSSFIGTSEQAIFRARGYQAGTDSADHEIRDIPAGGLWTSPRDLSHYVQMLFAEGQYKGQQVLTAESIKEMFRPQNAGNSLDFDCQIGLGWFLSPCGDEVVSPGLRLVQHSGSTGDFVAQLSVLPEQQLAVIVMSNADSGEDMVAPLATRILRLMLQAQGHPDVAVDNADASPVHLSKRRVPAPADRQRLSGFYATAWGVFRIKDDGERLYGELSGNRFELLRDNSGWLRAQKKWLGFWLQDLGQLGRVQLDVMSVQGRQILTLKSHGQLLPLGERIEPVPLSSGWEHTVGTYQVLNSESPDASLSHLNIRLEEGFLVASGQVHEQPLADYILTPVDNAHAVVAGIGRGLGDTVSRQINGISALGYNFKRINPPHNYLSF